MIVDFASGLDRFGDKIALIGDGDEPMSYSALASAADAFLAKLGSRPQLLIIEAMNDRATMVALLGALRGRHPVILTAPGGDAKSDLALRFGASAVVRGGNQVSTGYQSPPMHPNLAVMLSTSGTTGSTKLVRLSHDNLAANAIAIAEYLEITHEDRAITSLSPHYSYGLSVLTSHLASGAAIVLNDHSVADLDFRNACIERAITSIAGVPYSYELLERVGFRDWAPQSLRTMTQAGGSLSPLIAARFGAWSEERGVRFFVMYGQTEATARIAYVPPDRKSVV